MSKDTLTIYTLGFFLYPYTRSSTGGTIERFAAPSALGHRVAVYRWRGRKNEEIKLPEGRIDVTIDVEEPRNAPSGPATVRRARLVNGLPPDCENLPVSSGSDDDPWANFELVPDESVMRSPMRLRADWHKDVSLSVVCRGGEVTAVPDSQTFFRRWRWRGGNRQVVSSLCRYRIGTLKKGVVNFGAKPVKVVAGDVIVIFNSVPSSAMDTHRIRYQRGLDHHVSICALCESESEIVLHNPLDHEPAGVLPMANTVQQDPGGNHPAREYMQYIDPLKPQFHRRPITAGAAVLEAGYPSCGSFAMAI